METLAEALDSVNNAVFLAMHTISILMSVSLLPMIMVQFLLKLLHNHVIFIGTSGGAFKDT